MNYSRKTLRQRPYLLCSFLFLVHGAALICQPQMIAPSLQNGLDQLSYERVRHHMEVLADDSLLGRATGSPGAMKAAFYIASELESYGVRPAGLNRTFFQDILFHSGTPQPSSVLSVEKPGQPTSHLQLWNDYLLLTSGASTYIQQSTQVVFAGYGIVAPEYDYNDYGGLDVEGKVVLCLEGEPSSKRPDYFNGEYPTSYSNLAFKHRNAVARGALGTIILPLPRIRSFADWEYWKTQFLFEDVRLPYGPPERFSALMNLEKAGELLAGSGTSLDELIAMDSLGVMKSFPIDLRISFNGVFHERDFVSPNVIGIIEGGDPLLRDSYVLLSAHYDHLGVSRPVSGDSIYNGAMDNSAGVAALLEIARITQGMKNKPARSIILLFTTAEEKGLLGSAYYCAHPAIPLHQTVANINIDGVAFFDDFTDVIGVGAELSTLGELLRETARHLDLSVAPLPTIFSAEDPFTLSDNYSFAQAGIPSIVLYEGLHYINTPYDEGVRRYVEWGRKVYHTPVDDLSQPLMREPALRHLGVLMAFTHAVASTYTPPQWLPGVTYLMARLQSIAEGR